MKTYSALKRSSLCLLMVVSAFLVNNADAQQAPLSVAPNGNVGVGTEQPATKFHVAGNAGISGVLDLGIGRPGRDTNSGKIGYGTLDTGSLCIVGAGATGAQKITFWNQGGAKFNGSAVFLGNVSVNKTTPATAALEVNGRIKDQTGYVVPVGGIIMYAGNSDSLFDRNGLGKPNTPVQGWALCNGNNNTPNLLNRFIVGGGPGSGYGSNTGATGGNNTHTITINEMPAHAHNYTKAGLWGGGNAQAHSYDSWGYNANIERTDFAGGGGAMDMRPPYYSLFYIMKQ